MCVCVCVCVCVYYNCGVMGPNQTIGFWALAEKGFGREREKSESKEEYLSSDKLNVDRV